MTQEMLPASALTGSAGRSKPSCLLRSGGEARPYPPAPTSRNGLKHCSEASSTTSTALFCLGFPHEAFDRARRSNFPTCSRAAATDHRRWSYEDHIYILPPTDLQSLAPLPKTFEPVPAAELQPPRQIAVPQHQTASMSRRGAPAAYREPTTAAATPSIQTPSIVGWTANNPASGQTTARFKATLNNTVLRL